MANEINQHPALKGFNPTWEGVKHVGGTAIKWAAYGAMAAGAIALPFAALGGGLGALGTILSSASFASGAASGAMTVLSGALTVGAGAGAIGGAIKSLTNVDDAIANKKMDRIADADQALISQQRRQMMAQAMMQRPQNMQAGGVSPNVNFGMAPQNMQGMRSV